MSRYARSTRVAWVDDSVLGGPTPLVVITPLPDGPITVMPDSAALIWHALETPGTFEEIVATLAQDNDWEPESIAGDVAAFLEHLLAHDLITRQ